MCFFIVLMGDITVVSQNEFLMTMTSFRGNLGVLEGGKSLAKGQLSELGQSIMSLPSKKQGRKLDKTLKRAEEALRVEIQSRYVRLREDERGMVISLSSDVFFEPGSAIVKPEMRVVIRKINEILKNIDNFIRVEGHTDDKTLVRGAANKNYRNNWELSSARSVRVVEHLVSDGSDPRQLSAVAFGEFRPIDDNDTPEGRAYNRRVDVVILKESFLEESENKEIKRPLPDEEWR